MRFEESTLIAAPVDLIWRLTVQIEDWPAFLPTVQRLERLDAGGVRVGSTARVKQPGQLSAVWTVTRLDPSRDFTWESSRPGLHLAGSHLLEPVGPGTRMTLILDVTGRAAGVMSALLGSAMRASLRREAAGFRQHAATVS